MKVTVEIPDNTLVMTYQFVFEDEKSFNLQLQQKALDSKALEDMKESAKNDTDT